MQVHASSLSAFSMCASQSVAIGECETRRRESCFCRAEQELAGSERGFIVLGLIFGRRRRRSSWRSARMWARLSSQGSPTCIARRSQQVSVHDVDESDQLCKT